jgi:hypothetical protein
VDGLTLTVQGLLRGHRGPRHDRADREAGSLEIVADAIGVEGGIVGELFRVPFEVYLLISLVERAKGRVQFTLATLPDQPIAEIVLER